MRAIRRGDHGTAVAEIRSILRGLELLDGSVGAGSAAPAEFDEQTEVAVRAFQQSRGLSVDGQIGDETWRALEAARWRLGARTLYQSVAEPLIGDDVHQLQERLLEMGYDVGRADGIYGPRTARAVAMFQAPSGGRPTSRWNMATARAVRGP